MNHLGKDVAVHFGTERTLERIVVSLVEDRALDREPRDRRDHARIAVAGIVMIADRPGPEVAGGLLLVVGNRLAFFGLPLNPLAVLRDPVLQVRLRIPRSDGVVKRRELGLSWFAVHRAEHGQRRPSFDGGPAA